MGLETLPLKQNYFLIGNGNNRHYPGNYPWNYIFPESFFLFTTLVLALIFITIVFTSVFTTVVFTTILIFFGTRIGF